MSLNAANASKDARRSCHACRGRKARFRYRGEVRADRDHVLCFACFRSARDRRRAQAQVESAIGGTPRALFESTPLSDRQIGHRRQMLAHLAAAERR